MSIEPSTNNNNEDQGSGSGSKSDSWREVGEQIQGLVTRIAESFRSAWAEERSSTPDDDDTARKLEDDLRASADRLERVFKRVATETEEERSATFKTTREASSRAMGDARVLAARGLRSLNDQLDQLAKNLERERAEREKTADRSDDASNDQS